MTAKEQLQKYFKGKAKESNMSRVDVLSDLHKSKYILLLRFKEWTEGRDVKIQMKTLDWALEQFGQDNLSDKIKPLFNDNFLESQGLKRNDIIKVLQIDKGKMSRLMKEPDSLPLVDKCLRLCDKLNIEVLDSEKEEKQIAPLDLNLQVLKLEVANAKLIDEVNDLKAHISELSIENMQFRKKLEKLSKK